MGGSVVLIPLQYCGVVTFLKLVRRDEVHVDTVYVYKMDSDFPVVAQIVTNHHYVMAIFGICSKSWLKIERVLN